MVTHELPQRSMKHVKNCLTSGPSSKRHAPVECEFPSEICDPVAAAKRVLSEVCGLKELAREGARVQGQPAAKGEDDRSSDVSEPPPLSEPPRVVPGRRHRTLRIHFDHLMCRDGRLKKISLLKRRASRALAVQRFLSNRAWDVPHVCDEARAPSGRRRRNRLRPGRVL